MDVDSVKSGIGKFGKIIGFIAIAYIAIFSLYSLYYFNTANSRLMEYGLSEATAKLLAIAIMLIAIAVPAKAALRILATRGRAIDYAAVMILPLVFWGIAQLPARFSGITGEALVYCVTRPDGEEYCSDYEGYDPETGLKLTAMTQTSAEEQYRRAHEMYPVLIDQPFESIEFFDTLSNKPLVWIHETGDGCFEAFDNKGIHPREGVPLIPVTREHVLNMRACLERKEFQVKQQTAEREEAVRQQAEERRVAQEKADRQAYQARYTRRSSIPLQIGIGVSDGTRIDGELTRAMTRQIGTENNSTFLLDASIRDGVFGKLYEGDVVEARKLDLDQIASTTLLGQFSISYSDNSSIAGATNAEASLAVRSIDSSTGKILQEAYSTTKTLGYSQNEARRKVIDNLTKDIARQLN